MPNQGVGAQRRRRISAEKKEAAATAAAKAEAEAARQEKRAAAEALLASLDAAGQDVRQAKKARLVRPASPDEDEVMPETVGGDFQLRMAEYQREMLLEQQAEFRSLAESHRQREAAAAAASQATAAATLAAIQAFSQQQGEKDSSSSLSVAPKDPGVFSFFSEGLEQVAKGTDKGECVVGGAMGDAVRGGAAVSGDGGG
jgi:hypothetical protein